MAQVDVDCAEDANGTASARSVIAVRAPLLKSARFGSIRSFSSVAGEGIPQADKSMDKDCFGWPELLKMGSRHANEVAVDSHFSFLIGARGRLVPQYTGVSCVEPQK